MITKFILVGPYEGRTGFFGGQKFVNGEATLRLEGNQIETVSRLLSYYQAYPEGSPELMKARAFHAEQKGERDGGSSEVFVSEGTSDGGVGADESAAKEGAAGEGSAGVEATGEGVQGSDPDGWSQTADLKLVNILKALDPDNDEHWTQGGLPRLSVIEEGYGSTALTRNDIQTALPGWTRDAAKQARELSEL